MAKSDLLGEMTFESPINIVLCKDYGLIFDDPMKEQDDDLGSSDLPKRRKRRLSSLNSVTVNRKDCAVHLFLTVVGLVGL